MRNYLPFKKPERLQKIKRRLRPYRGLGPALVLLVFAIVTARFVLAVGGQVCNGAAGTQSVTANASAGGTSWPANTVIAGTDQWISNGSVSGGMNTNMAYRIYEYYSHNENAGSGDWCTTQFAIDPTTSFYQLNTVQPVNVRLGVPNMGADNNNGLWRLNAGLGSSFVANFRPPKYGRNFDSNAVYNDDGGELTMRSNRFNNTTGAFQNYYKIWCKNWDASVGMPGADTAGGCSPDITSFADGSNAGAGWMFVQDNCHIGDPNNGFGATNNQDADGTTLSGCNGNTANNDPQNNYYGAYISAGASAGVKMHPNNQWYCAPTVPGVPCTDPEMNLSLKDFIGCTAIPLADQTTLCDGKTQSLRAFNIDQFARNHQTSNGADARILSSATDMTYAYPLPAVVQANLSTSNCSTTPGHTVLPNDVNTTGCSSPPPSGSNSSFVITVTDSPRSLIGFTHAGNLANATVTATFDGTKLSYVAGSASISNAVCSGIGPSSSNITGSSADTITWSLTKAQMDAAGMNPEGSGVGYIKLCFSVATKAGSSGNYHTLVDTSGTLDKTGLTATTDHEDNQNFINGVQFPYATTFLGDVHAGGGILGISANCQNSANALSGQGDGASTGSKGDYVISAGGNITNFGSNAGVGDTTLQAKSINGVCRPDMVAAAQRWLKRANMAIGVYCHFYSWPVITDSNVGTLESSRQHMGPNYGSLNVDGWGDTQCGGTLESDGTNNNDVSINTINSPIQSKSRITLWVHGDLLINGNVSHSTGQHEDYRLSSFGTIVEGNIYIAGNVTDLYGLYWAKGNIYTCANTSTKTEITGGNSLVSNCHNPLRVYGMLSGHNVYFDRVGPVGTNGLYNSEAINPANPITPSDTTQYFGLLFLAPPPAFDGSFPAAPGGPVSQQNGPPLY